MNRVVLLAAIAALMASCAVDPGATGPVDVDADASVSERVIGHMPNGLDIVAAETLPFAEPTYTSSADKSSSEPFSCHDEWNYWCGPVSRSSQAWSRYDASHTTTITGYGDPGEGTSNFYVWNGWPAKTISRPSDPGAGSVQWTFGFQPGSTCNTPGNCVYFVCLDQGVPWPRCIQTSWQSGATNEWSGEPWAVNTTKRFTLAYWALGGTVPTSTTTETIYVWTSPGW
jgi:hypothetical protein